MESRVWHEAYVYESLVSYRHKCRINRWRMAHYVQRRSEADRFASPAVRSAILIDSVQLPTGRSELWFRARPAPQQLPPLIDQPCLPR